MVHESKDNISDEGPDDANTSTAGDNGSKTSVLKNLKQSNSTSQSLSRRPKGTLYE